MQLNQDLTGKFIAVNTSIRKGSPTPMTLVSTIAYKTLHNLNLHIFIVTFLSANYQSILIPVSVVVVTSIVVTAAANFLGIYMPDFFSYITSFNIPVNITCLVSLIPYYNSMRQYYYYYLHFNDENTKFQGDCRTCPRSHNHTAIEKINENLLRASLSSKYRANELQNQDLTSYLRGFQTYPLSHLASLPFIYSPILCTLSVNFRGSV